MPKVEKELVSIREKIDLHTVADCTQPTESIIAYLEVQEKRFETCKH